MKSAQEFKIISFLIFLVVVGCAPTNKFNIRDELNNVEMIEKSSEKLEFPTDYFNEFDRVSLVSLESKIRAVKEVGNLIQDNLMKNFQNHKIPVMEREQKLLKDFFLEQNVQKGEDDLAFGTKFNFERSNKIVAYRVLECGLRFEEDLKNKSITRHAFTKLRIRIIESNSSHIIWSGIIEGEFSDILPNYIYHLVNEPLIFYAHGLPAFQYRVKESLVPLTFETNQKEMKPKKMPTQFAEYDQSSEQRSQSFNETLNALGRLRNIMFQVKGMGGYSMYIGHANGANNYKENGFTFGIARIQKKQITV